MTTNNEKKYILIAEDDTAYGNVYKTKLENEGFDVTVVENGELVLGEMERRKPDLLILDLMMSDKNGFEVLQELRSNDKFKEMKVIVASNLSQHADVEKVSALQAIDYFVKSDVSVTEMVEKIKKALA